MKHGEPAVELVRFRKRGGIDFGKLDEARRRLGMKDDIGHPLAVRA